MAYSVLAYYLLVPISDPEKVLLEHKIFFQNCDVRSRVYISTQGINAQVSILNRDLDEYLHWLHKMYAIPLSEVKIHTTEEHAFPRKVVKIRRELVAMNLNVPLDQQEGIYLSPSQWKEKLNNMHNKGDILLLDVRNNYETRVGYFMGATTPNLCSFREFISYGKRLLHRVNPKKTEIMMYCTGGIRCAFYARFLKQLGFDLLFQLKGGIIQYGLEEGSCHWRGKLFVFDDRMVIPISAEEVEIFSSCCFCLEKSDIYYNCANMDCNRLFISCLHCIQEFRGCCSKRCLDGGRVRCFSEKAKPFRKLLHEEKKVLSFHQKK